MLHAKDLMIGDWVTFEATQNEKNPILIKIWQLNDDGEAFVFIENYEALDEIDINEEVVGIPLTPEILEKNFEFLYRSVPGGIYAAAQAVDTYRAGGVTINYVHESQYAEILNIRYVVFRYVHELQHALKLCGIDKDIEL